MCTYRGLVPLLPPVGHLQSRARLGLQNKARAGWLGRMDVAHCSGAGCMNVCKMVKNKVRIQLLSLFIQ